MHTRRRRPRRVWPGCLAPFRWRLLAAGLCGPGAATAEAVPVERLLLRGGADIRSSEVHRKVAALQLSLERSAVAKGLLRQVQAFEQHP